MNPILCISKSDMPQMMYEIGKASMTNTGWHYLMMLFIVLILIMCWITAALLSKNKKTELFGMVILFTLSSFALFFVDKNKETKKIYKFNNFTYNQPAKFVLQYYTVTTGKQYKFIAETKHNVFIKEEK